MALLFKFVSLLDLSQRPENMPIKFLEKNSPPCFAPQATDIPNPHGAHNLQQLIMPGTEEVYDPIGDPVRRCLFDLNGTRESFLTPTAHTAFKGDERGKVDGSVEDRAQLRGAE